MFHKRWRLAAVGSLASMLLGACGVAEVPPITTSPVRNVPSMLEAQGPAANEIAGLWWLLFWVSVAVVALVFGLLAWGLWRRRADVGSRPTTMRGQPEQALPGGERTWVVGGGIVMPAGILIGVLAATLSVMRSTAATVPSSDVVIEIVGHQWWWEVRYPIHNFTTANEIRIPVGVPVELRMTGADVIHSLWIPELHGKMDLIPGRTTSLVIQADQAGEFLAQCTEFCGTQHAKMRLVVVAESPEAFAIWIRGQQAEVAAPTDENQRRGQQIFLGAACVYCHTVRGTNATGQVGPDLTHLASRRTIAAGFLPNNRGHLAGWILDPQALKPGNLMPPTALSGEDLNDLLIYLESLK